MILGEAQRTMFRQFDEGVVIAVKLFGEEKVFWALRAQHAPEKKKAIKHLVDGEARREESRTLINVEKQLNSFSFEELERSSFKIEIPFSIPLPADLPPTFFYCGEMMSCLSVSYKLTAMMFGLKSSNTQSATPEGTLVIQDEQYLNLRELEI